MNLQDLFEFAPDEGGGSRKFIPWPEFIEQLKQILHKDFDCKENIVKSTIKARFVPHDPMEYGPTMLYSYYETRGMGRDKGAVSTRGSIQVGKYTKGGLFGQPKDQLLTGFSLLKGHPFERHFDLTFDNIYKIANIIKGNTQGALEFQPQQQGVAEGTGNVGASIRALCQKIYNAGDDEFEYFYHDSPIFAQYWDEYEGDLDSIIAEVDPSELQVMLDELESYVQNANLAEGDVAKLAGITALGIGAGLGANYIDQQQPRVEFDGKNGQVVRAYLEPAWTNRVPDNAMVIKGKDGKTYHVWSSAGKGMNSKSYHAAPVEPVKEGWTKLPNGNYRNMHTGVTASKPPVKKKRGEKTGAEWDAIEKAKKDKEQGVAEMDGNGSGRDGSNRKRIGSYGNRDRDDIPNGPDIHLGPEHVMTPKKVVKHGVSALHKAWDAALKDTPKKRKNK